MAETLEELKKQKEDIEALITSLDDAFNEASITEDNYKQVKAQNQAKLDEINKKIEAAMAEKVASGDKASGEPTPKPAQPKPGTDLLPIPEEEPAVRKRGRPKKVRTPQIIPTEPEAPPAPAAKRASAPQEPITEAHQTAPPTPLPPAETPPPTGGENFENEGAPQGNYEGIPQPLTEVEGEEKEIRSASKTGLRKLKEDIKAMILNTIKESKMEDNKELADKLQKTKVDLEKLKSFVEATKEERSSSDERFQRTAEEVGELRTSLNEMEGKFSEVEMKVQELAGITRNLNPQSIKAMFEKMEDQIKIYQSTIDKLDDMMAAVARRVNEMEGNLKQIGSLENIAKFSKEITGKVLDVDTKQRNVQRTSDRLDGVFAELNKRLEEFMLYKAKQDTIDQLTQELMRGMDEINTRLSGYAEKSDLNLMKDTILSQIDDLRKSTTATTGPSGPGSLDEIEKQRSELQEFIKALEEQYKSGAIKKEDYDRAKADSDNKLRELDEKGAKALGAAGPAGTGPASQNKPEKAESKEEPSKKEKEEPAEPRKKENLFGGMGLMGGEGPEKVQEESEAAEKLKEGAVPSDEKKEDAEKPETTEQEGVPQGEKKEAEEKPEPPVTEKKAEEKPNQPNKKERMLKEIEDSYKAGLISEAAYKATKRVIESMKQ
jgi:predicted nuclease with TOPRIM domain